MVPEGTSPPGERSTAGSADAPWCKAEDAAGPPPPDRPRLPARPSGHAGPLPGPGSHGEPVTSCAPRAAGAARPLRRAGPWPARGSHRRPPCGKTPLQTRPPSSAGGPPAPDANPPALREGKTRPAPGADLPPLLRASPPRAQSIPPAPPAAMEATREGPDPSYPIHSPCAGAGAAPPPGHRAPRPCTGCTDRCAVPCAPGPLRYWYRCRY